MLILAFATDKERDKALGGFRSALVKNRLPFSLFDRDIACDVTGVGPLNAGISGGQLLERYSDIQGVINLGIAGSFSLDSLPLTSTVVVKMEIWPEYGLRGTDCIDPRGLGFSHGFVGGDEIWDTINIQFRENARTVKVYLDPRWGTGAVSLSVAGVTGEMDNAARLVKRYGADIENMEGFAMALACGQRDIPFLEIRTISNLVGSRNAEDWNIGGALKKQHDVLVRMLSEQASD
jgi:futalosine hydrolase